MHCWHYAEREQKENIFAGLQAYGIDHTLCMIVADDYCGLTQMSGLMTHDVIECLYLSQSFDEISSGHMMNVEVFYSCILLSRSCNGLCWFPHYAWDE